MDANPGCDDRDAGWRRPECSVPQGLWSSTSHEALGFHCGPDGKQQQQHGDPASSPGLMTEPEDAARHQALLTDLNMQRH